MIECHTHSNKAASAWKHHTHESLFMMIQWMNADPLSLNHDHLIRNSISMLTWEIHTNLTCVHTGKPTCCRAADCGSCGWWCWMCGPAGDDCEADWWQEIWGQSWRKRSLSSDRVEPWSRKDWTRGINQACICSAVTTQHVCHLVYCPPCPVQHSGSIIHFHFLFSAFLLKKELKEMGKG